MTKVTKRKTPQDFPEYTAAWSRVCELRVEHAEANQRALDHELNRGTAVQKDELQSAAVAVLAGAPPSDETPSLVELKREAEVLGRATQLAESKFREVSRSVSRQIVAELKPVHEHLVGAITDGLRILQDALQAEVDFRDELRELGVSDAGLIVVSANEQPRLLRDVLHLKLDVFAERFRRHGYTI